MERIPIICVQVWSDKQQQQVLNQGLAIHGDAVD
jgi:hypothetical protein